MKNVFQAACSSSLVFALILFGSCLPVVMVRAGSNNLVSEEYTSKNGALKVVINVTMGWSLNGARYSALYNGKPIGPTLRVKPGDVLTVTLNNQLPPSPAIDRELYHYVTDPRNMNQTTNLTIIANRLDSIGNINNPTYGYWGFHYKNLHFHGAMYDVDVENLARGADGGESITYVHHIFPDQPPGLFWYHNHMHGTAAHSMMSGQYGFLVIEDKRNKADIRTVPEIKAAKEHFLMLAEFLPGPDGKTPPPSFPIAFSFNWIHVTNGMNGDNYVMTYQQGDTILFRACSATVEPNIYLRLDNHNFTIVSIDGYPIEKPITTDRITIGSGQRVDFLVQLKSAGNYTFHRDPWNAGGITGEAACLANFGVPNVSRCISFDVPKIVGTLVVLPKKKYQAPKPLPSKLPSMDKNLRELLKQAPVANRTVSMDVDTSFPLFQIDYNGPFVPPGIAFGMNNMLFTPFAMAGDIQAGTCETWLVLSNPPGFIDHPFHVHSVPFYVFKKGGVHLDSPYWTDTELVATNFTAHVCFPHAKPGQRIMAHCHMPSHVDIGMMAEYMIVPGPTKAPKGKKKPSGGKRAK